MAHRRLSPAGLLILVLQLTGCMTWRPTAVSPGRLIADEEPPRVRVTQADGTTSLVYDPEVVSHSVVGVSNRRGSPQDSLTFALESITRLEVERVSVWRTVGALGASVVGLGIMATADEGGRTHQGLAAVSLVALTLFWGTLPP